MKRHLVYIVGCVVLSFIVLNVKIDTWQKYSPYILIFVGFLLVAVLFVGVSVNGSRRWLAAGPIRIQVTEVAKFAFVLYMAGYLVRRHQEIVENYKGFYKPIIVVLVYAILILMQPDLGTVVVLFVITIGLLFLAGARLLDFFMLIIAGVTSIGALIYFEPYRLKRMTSFMNPWQDALNTGYQLTQSLMAYGRGGWFGQGLGNSILKESYLPEAHTDFILAIIGEELGYVGVIIVLSLLLFISFKAIRLGHRCLMREKPFAGYLSYGIGIWFAFQTVVNSGASVGLLPTKGLTLPFISYGGSSLWIMTIAAMILIRIDYENR